MGAEQQDLSLSEGDAENIIGGREVAKRSTTSTKVARPTTSVRPRRASSAISSPNGSFSPSRRYEWLRSPSRQYTKTSVPASMAKPPARNVTHGLSCAQ